ncbi:MAG TPA: nucleotide disphospho-sugar-binding domain-containing protein [Burkholderiales bacterium]|nr:nucleotide disphospho-sugar-binding domain-containing protein [Burkholderiales bacterium]
MTPDAAQAGRRRRVDFAWELGGGTGHVAMLLPLARAMRARGHEVRLLLRETGAAAGLGAGTGIACEPAPVWAGPVREANPLNFGEILSNFGYQYPNALRRLVEAWRERLAGSAAVVANVAPAAHIAARTLGIPSFEASQGFHVPPPALPCPPLRDWEPAPRARLEAADRAVLAAINAVLASHGAAPLASVGELFEGRSMLLTYPELDIYSERGPAEYFGIPETGEGRDEPPWPEGAGLRAFAYVYRYYPGLEALIETLERMRISTLMLCRDIDPALRARRVGGTVRIALAPMAASSLLPQADIVICHGSHQMSAQALLAGRPLLMLPTQLEQFLITRRVVRMGAGLGIAPETARPDFGAALAALGQGGYGDAARAFARRYAAQDRRAALATVVARCEQAMAGLAA